MLEQCGEDRDSELRRYGGDLGVGGDEEEKGGGDRGPHVGGVSGGRRRRRDGALDEGREAVGDGEGVGLEDGGVDFGENRVDRFTFRAELNGEVGFKLVDELGDDVRLEGFEITECEE